MKNTFEESGTKESRNSFEEYKVWLKERKIEFEKYIKPYLENQTQQGRIINNTF